MASHPPSYDVVHPLPPAPNFVGRAAELGELRDIRQQGFRGVLALVGLGGAGKTALAATFLDELTAAASSRPKGLFVWSFYQEPDAGLFLERAYQYFTAGSAAAPAKGAGLLHLLHEALAADGPYWLVLDGLERVQCQENTSTERYGQVEDPLLKSLLTRIAAGIGQTVALVTSRFPLTDLHSFAGGGYRAVEVGGLDRASALSLLRHRGVKGDDDVLGELVNTYGAHALTVDHLGGVIGQFLEGNPFRAPEVAELISPAQDRQAFRLARLLKAYEDHLPAEELALLCRLCLLRRSVTEEQAAQFFLCAPSVHARTVREISSFVERFPGLDAHFSAGCAVDLAASIRETLDEALYVGPIAGPEQAFRAEITTIIEKVLELRDLEIEFAELARLYADPDLEHPTDALPLKAPHRQAVRSLYARYASLSEHPLNPFEKTAPALEQGFFAKMSTGTPMDLVAADIVSGLKQTKRRLRYLAGKHFALRRLRELCKVGQRKWSLAGPLATLDMGGLREVLSALVGRHLILREADGSFSVHPAVRDHFGRLASAPDQGAWHDVLREHLVSLAQRPGRRLPADAATLDLGEEAIHHALTAGRAKEALGLYHHVLGGLRHLAWKLGEMARGMRILRSFEPCPERWDLAWYLRALGEFAQAFALNELPFFRADILLLQGRLPEVAKAGDSSRVAVAEFLMGKTTKLPPDELDSAIPRAQLLLYLGQPDRAQRSAALDGFYGEIGWEGARARCQLFLADAARRQADEAKSARLLDMASVWILHSGSVEHLGLLHLMRGRFARTARQPATPRPFTAAGELAEGLRLTQQCGLRLYQIELLCEQAAFFLAEGNIAAAEPAAREALRQASAADCQFLWGAGRAGHLVGEALLLQARRREARRFLGPALQLRRRIGDPEALATEQLLADSSS